MKCISVYMSAVFMHNCSCLSLCLCISVYMSAVSMHNCLCLSLCLCSVSIVCPCLCHSVFPFMSVPGDILTVVLVPLLMLN